MNTAKWMLGSLIVALLGIGLQPSDALGQSRSWKFPENNNNVIQAQRDGGVRADTGAVTIDYFGHMAFRITSPRGLKIMIDPWRNDPSGYWGVWFPKPFPEVPVDIVLSTHAHFDHDAVYRPHGVMVLERMAGEFSLGDVKITGLADKHQCHSPGWYHWTDAGAEFHQQWCPPNNPLHMDNFIQVIETGGVRIVQWGDNRPQPAEHVMAALKSQGVDVLILPIDGSNHILGDDQANAIVAAINPKIVIPAHYYMKGVSSVLSTLRDASRWAKSHDALMLDSSRLVLRADDLAKLGNHPRVYYFDDHFTRE